MADNAKKVEKPVDVKSQPKIRVERLSRSNPIMIQAGN